MTGRCLFSLGLVAALVQSISLPAHAELFKNFKTDGSFETRSFGINNETDRNSLKDDYRGETNYRILLGGSFDLLDDVHGRALLSHNDLQAGTGTNGNSISSLESSTFVENAYVKVDKVFGHVDLTIGRQFYGDPNDLNIYYGPHNDDVLSVASVDVFRADADIMEWAKFQGIAGKTADTGVIGAASNTDTDLWGGELNTDKLIPKGNLAVYYYTLQHKAVKPPAAGNNTLSDAGVRLAGEVPVITGLGYHAEYIQDFGRNNSATGTPAYHGNAYFLNAHYGSDVRAMPVRAHVEFGRGSRDFVAISPSARFGIIWGEHTTSASAPSNLNTAGAQTGPTLSNMKIWDGGVGINPIAKLGLDVNVYRFQYDANENGAGTSAGTEYDFIISWKHSDNVYLEANAASFQVGTALQNVAGSVVGVGAAPNGTNPITRLGADVKIKF